ncbi:hypothetical protein J6590_030177 [Homalodisca vitripennis]|nr:hypothetical protein J6590_030177 [Homalodisca vitripennis]
MQLQQEPRPLHSTSPRLRLWRGGAFINGRPKTLLDNELRTLVEADLSKTSRWIVQRLGFSHRGVLDAFKLIEKVNKLET